MPDPPAASVGIGGTAGTPELAEPADGPPAGAQPARRTTGGWLVTVLVALVITILVRLLVVQTFTIPSASMVPTLHVGDRVLIDKASYRVRDPHRGEVVVFDGAGSWDPSPIPTRGVARVAADWLRRVLALPQPGTTDYVKRVVGLPGDHVVCCDKASRLVVDGQPLDEPYLGSVDPTPFDVVVPPARLWVMGDNRQDSADSRAHRYDPGGGSIPIGAVLGRAVFVVWPRQDWGPVH